MRASNWLANTKSQTPSHTDRNPTFIIRNSSTSAAAQRVCHLHVDGAWKEGYERSEISFTASQPNGLLVAKQALSTFSSTPTQTELQACYEAIKWALLHNYNMVYIYSDCFNAIMQIAGKTECHFHDIFLLRKIAEKISKLSFCQISKVARCSVQRAHLLAKMDLMDLLFSLAV